MYVQKKRLSLLPNDLSIPVGLVALILCAIGIINSLPTWGIIPRIGPFDSEAIRPLMFGLSIGILILKNPFYKTFLDNKKLNPIIGLSFDILISVAVLSSLILYYTEMKALNEGLFYFEWYHALTGILGALVILILCWRQWGPSLSVFGVICLVYLYTGQYWPGIFETAPVDIIDTTASDLWFNQNDGILGMIAGIVIFNVLPFILLGSMLEGTGAGLSLIKISFNLMRNFRGGPAHAAIVASGMFGTISGGAVANVVGTGVLTIPMIKKRGFDSSFAGGVEATASSGGQIMPPIMGAAALVLADFVGVSYLTVITAALVPALAYYASLFATVYFESQRLGIEIIEKENIEKEMLLNNQDYKNVILIFAPILTVLSALISGLSPAGSGITALFVLIILSFINPDVRRNPSRLINSLIKGGINFAQVMIAVGVIGIITAVLGATNLPGDFAIIISSVANNWLILTLILAMLAAILLGMGMPTLTAYLTIALILGPSMNKLGLEPLTTHMFVFYYGVASNITPPVALAAFAAAAIANAAPLETAMKAMRIGLVMFIIPFVFAYYPILLLVESAGAIFNWPEFISIISRLALVIYLLSSAGSGFDQRKLSYYEILIRIVLAIAVLLVNPWIHWPIATLILAMIFLHKRKNGKLGGDPPPLTVLDERS